MNVNVPVHDALRPLHRMSVQRRECLAYRSRCDGVVNLFDQVHDACVSVVNRPQDIHDATTSRSSYEICYAFGGLGYAYVKTMSKQGFGMKNGARPNLT